ncbi:hypothetical protein VNI00_003831 [Paramarasmius palmivorus]|uniref:Terpene synthase n=1 Tax=Paramarasmius palmivorus TaxID=297713 RepID=A0AAW0DQF7_9AGAR
MLRSWPWSRSMNPFHALYKEKATIAPYGIFTDHSQRAFDRCDFPLLAALTYTRLNQDGYHIACEFLNFLFMVDEHLEVASTVEARHIADTVLDALRNPGVPRPDGEWIGGEITRSFWEKATKTGTPSFQRRFIDTTSEYLDGCVEHAIDRSQSNIYDVETYFTLRRKTVGVLPSFAVLGIHMNLTDKVFKDPVIQRLTELAVDMIIVRNDTLSYNVEQARGDDSHNVIKILMETCQTDIQGALNRASFMHDQLSTDFLDLIGEMPTFGDTNTDEEVFTYVNGLAQWVRGNDSWSFESHRYFGSAGPEIQKTGIVQLLPKICSASLQVPGECPAGAEIMIKHHGLV